MNKNTRHFLRVSDLSYNEIQKLFENYPVLFVDKYSDATEELLIANDHLFQKAQTMDLSGLTLPTFFDRIVEKALK